MEHLHTWISSRLENSRLKNGCLCDVKVNQTLPTLGCGDHHVLIGKARSHVPVGECPVVDFVPDWSVRMLMGIFLFSPGRR